MKILPAGSVAGAVAVPVNTLVVITALRSTTLIVRAAPSTSTPTV